MTPRRTDFVLDLLDFMEEKLREALRDETSRVGAVNEAGGAVPVLRDRLRENELVQSQFMLVLGNELFEPHASERWRDLARPLDQYLRRLACRVEPIELHPDDERSVCEREGRYSALLVEEGLDGIP